MALENESENKIYHHLRKILINRQRPPIAVRSKCIRLPLDALLAKLSSTPSNEPTKKRRQLHSPLIGFYRFRKTKTSQPSKRYPVIIAIIIPTHCPILSVE